MTEIKGSYLYDLKTGQTVGCKHSKIEESTEKQEYSTQYSTYRNGSYYDLLNSFVQTPFELGDKVGSVEDLSFEQTINLFIQGNMTTDELKIGLESKGVNNVNINESDGMTVVTFTYNQKNYTLKCATDAARSQIDNPQVNSVEEVEDAVTTESTAVETGHFKPYAKPSGYDCPGANGLVTKSYDGFYSGNRFTAYDYDVLMPKINETFGLSLKSTTELHSWLRNGITDEQKKSINEHPEIFHISVMDNGSCYYDTNDETKFWLEDGGYQMNAEEYYSYLVTMFGNSLNDEERYDNSPIKSVKCDGQNVEFTDKTVAKIQKYLTEKPDNKAFQNFMSLLDIKAEDDESTIWQKINSFCNSAGSTDGKTISLEKYYILTSKLDEYDTHMTYNEVVDHLELTQNASDSTQKVRELFNYDFIGTDCVSTESELFVKNYDYQKDTKVTTKIKSSELPSDARIVEFDSFDSEYSEFFYQIDDSNQYMLKPQYASIFQNAGICDNIKDVFRSYLTTRSYIIDVNLRSGNFNTPVNSVDDLLKIPDKFGVDNGPFTVENFLTYYKNIKGDKGYNYLFSAKSSPDYDYNSFRMSFQAMFPEYYGNQSKEIESEKKAAQNVVEAFASGNLSQEMLMFLDNETSLDLEPSTLLSHSGTDTMYTNCIEIAGIKIQLPIPDTSSKLYTAEDLKSLGIDRASVEVATIDKDGNKKYRLKPTNKEELRNNLINQIKQDTQQDNKQEEITTVNPDALFAYGNTVNADTILGAEMLYTTDDSVKKLALSFQNALEQYSSYLNTDSDKKTFVNHIIRRLNLAVEVQNTTPASLSKEALDKLNEVGIFDKIDEIINSESFNKLITDSASLDLPDGELLPNSFGQGTQVGDCGLISTVESLVSTDTGKKLIKDSIECNGDTITFHFKGIGLSYEFTTEELYEYIESTGEAHANGDIDMVVIEMALTKLIQDKLDGKYPELLGTLDSFYDKGDFADGRGKKPLIAEVSPGDVMKVLVPSTYALKNYEKDDSLGEIFKNHDCVAAVAIYPGSKATCVDGRVFGFNGVDFDGDGNPEGHAFAVTNVTDETITFDGYTMTWEEFNNMNSNPGRKAQFYMNPIFDEDAFEKDLYTIIVNPNGNTTKIEGSRYEFSPATIAELFNLMNSSKGDRESVQKTFEELFGWNSRGKASAQKAGEANSAQAKAVQVTMLEDESIDEIDTKTEEIVYKSEDVVSEMETAAEKLNLTAANTTGIYKQFSTQGSYLYIWNPQTKKFKAFSVNVRNADGTINQEFTQAGKAVNRTETNVYYEALLEAYKNGYNFTANYPWVCEKDGVYYEYDKEAGCFKKRAD